jgi:hypothetical protein
MGGGVTTSVEERELTPVRLYVGMSHLMAHNPRMGGSIHEFLRRMRTSGYCIVQRVEGQRLFDDVWDDARRCELRSPPR